MTDISNDAGAAPANQSLPCLSPPDYKKYNRMAETMDMFHTHFRGMWKTMYEASSSNTRPSGMSLRQFINLGLQFCDQLHMHHGIEEAHIFPLLAKKMPAFREELSLLTQHKRIHQGLEVLQAYLEGCKKGERELRMGEMKESMDTFGEVLWQHLDDEVEQLGAENMRKYWTLEEMQNMPI